MPLGVAVLYNFKSGVAIVRVLIFLTESRNYPQYLAQCYQLR